ncbi:GMP synthase large subunit [Thermoplasma volcanium GSS1]|uniref:GMP synthase [glutamine-hydrolyzing] subunit B n=1 Tax=Thermoplasma volcanium (strain ATCC 51530 / DSM 4299 / JCM 9571 / NBRC 15438 / GSS1) TaxID=273116 RepID=GUAAB_THEVO|nr:glutamine-hydrolyzing GMP synthase [Thermoplasma volcanium]Q97C09.1 RecName: Full=GMP synthase [glutamine-hydrolyzing] subunit B; AltName: Full=GMP synthetase [Thermoplasma volcanium GSS1]BAB59438.1 GMP synthase large subunit [Thermoplasma volcanium GSS1]
MSFSDYISRIKDNIRNSIKGKAIIAVSGGQDSSLLSLLASEVLGNNLLCVFIDTGLLRKNETGRVKDFFEKHSMNYVIVDAADTFINNLKGVTDPEEKRKIIGKTFIDVLSEQAQNFGAEYLLQGTIAPDWIESGGQKRDTIKSHHNVGGLPKDMKLKLVEPLRDYYKDEIRGMSKELGLPTDIQPFPGPGLAVRIIGEVTKEKLDLLRAVTDIVERKISEAMPSESRPWQYFAVLLPVRTTGVHGDRRAYGLTVGIRMIETTDAMTGTFSKPSWDLLEDISNTITDEIPEINRVVYDITNKPPATIEWE